MFAPQEDLGMSRVAPASLDQTYPARREKYIMPSI
jgi:hypothetical protein